MKKNHIERNNFQDRAEIAEYAKGERAAANANRAQRRSNKKRNSGSKYNRSSNRSANRDTGRNNAEMPAAGRANAQDFSWYNQNPVLTANVGNLDFANPTGNLLPGYPTEDQEYLGVKVKFTPFVLPGIATISLLPSVGVSINASSPFNNGNRALFSYLRQARSGVAPYEPADVGMVFTAVADAYSFANFMIRAYAEATQYSVFNKYLPIGLLRSDGLDAMDIINNRSTFRYGINYYISKLAQFKLPARITLLSRRAFLYSSLYIEGPSIKDQLYKYVPAGFSQLVDGTADDPATSIKVLPFTPSKSTGFTVSELLEYGAQLLDSLSNATSSSFAYIQADLLSAFGASDSAYVKLAFMPDETSLPIQQDINFLYQFKNATPVMQLNYNANLQAMCESLGVKQITKVGLSYAFSQPAILASTTTWGKIAEVIDMTVPAYLDVPTAEPTVEQVMEFTRLTVSTSVNIVDLKGYMYYSCGTELPWTLTFWTLDPESGSVTPFPVSRTILDSSTDPKFVNTIMSRVATARSFDYAPRLSIVEVNGDTTQTETITAPHFVWDWDNVTDLSYSELAKLHEVALLSEFTVPGISI